jgi:hypothetical protein
MTDVPQSDRDFLERILDVVNRILSLQRMDDITSDTLLLRSTQSLTCSAASTGGCCIQSNKLATPTAQG